jgi:hypothetical protein
MRPSPAPERGHEFLGALVKIGLARTTALTVPDFCGVNATIVSMLAIDGLLPTRA